MLPPLPRRGNGRHCLAHPSRHVSLPRIGGRVGPRIVLFEVCSAFTRVAACTLARPPNRGSLTRRLQPFRYLHSCSGASGWSNSPGGPLTHRKAPPYHGARQFQTVALTSQFAGKQPLTRRPVIPRRRRVRCQPTLATRPNPCGQWPPARDARSQRSPHTRLTSNLPPAAAPGHPSLRRLGQVKACYAAPDRALWRWIYYP